MNRILLGYNPDFDAFAAAAPARRGHTAFDNVDTLNLAIDLLEVDTPQLAPLMRRIVRRAGESAGRPLGEPVVSALSDLLESIARRTLPKQRGVAGSGAKGRFFGVELEGLSPEDQEFETAKAFVRFAGEAARRAAAVSEPRSPQAAARLAALLAARRHAPGWLRPAGTASDPTTGPRGPTPGARSASTF